MHNLRKKEEEDHGPGVVYELNSSGTSPSNQSQPNQLNKSLPQISPTSSDNHHVLYPNNSLLHHHHHHHQNFVSLTTNDSTEDQNPILPVQVNLSNNNLNLNLNHSPSPQQSIQRHSLTDRPSWKDRFKFSRVQYALLILLSIQTVMVVSILSATVAKIQKEIQMMDPQLKTISTYLAIFIIANVFSIVIAIDSLLNKNVAQLIALDLFNISMAVYGAVLPTQIKRSLRNPGGAVSWNGSRVGTSCNMYLSCYGVQYLYDEIKGWIIAIPVITGFFSALMCYLTWLIYKEIGWEIFKQIGADLTLKRIAQRKYLFYMLQKFVFFFIVGFSLQFLMLSSDVSALEKALTITALPFSLAAILLGGVAIRNEIRWMLGIYYVVLTSAILYFIYKLYRLYNNDSISSAVKSLTFFSVLTIMSLFATGITAYLCYMEFGKGLLAASVGLNESIWLRMIKDRFRRRSSGNSSSEVDENDKMNSKQLEPFDPNTNIIGGIEILGERSTTNNNDKNNLDCNGDGSNFGGSNYDRGIIGPRNNNNQFGDENVGNLNNNNNGGGNGNGRKDRGNRNTQIRPSNNHRMSLD